MMMAGPCLGSARQAADDEELEALPAALWDLFTHAGRPQRRAAGGVWPGGASHSSCLLGVQTVNPHPPQPRLEKDTAVVFIACEHQRALFLKRK